MIPGETSGASVSDVETADEIVADAVTPDGGVSDAVKLEKPHLG
jgi:hypothetical protein